MMLEAKLAPVHSRGGGRGRTALRVFVRDVARSGAAQRLGIVLAPALDLVCVFFLNKYYIIIAVLRQWSRP